MKFKKKKENEKSKHHSMSTFLTSWFICPEKPFVQVVTFTTEIIYKLETMEENKILPKLLLYHVHHKSSICFLLKVKLTVEKKNLDKCTVKICP